MPHFPPARKPLTIRGRALSGQPFQAQMQEESVTPIIKSALSVVGAFFVVAVLVGLTTTVVSRVMLPDGGAQAEPTTAFLIVNIVYSLAFAVVGGYVAATVSDHSPLAHAAGLSGFMMALGLTSWLWVNGGEPAPGQPAWYPAVMSLLVPPVAVFGGVLVTRRQRAKTSFSRRAREAGGVEEWKT